MKAFLFPGQGSQRKGMGAELFPKYPDYVKTADQILGYSIAELCLSDAENQINLTAYTQPAIFVVSVLTYLESLAATGRPDFVAGHSIGEYAALFVADVFDFATGLRIVQKRAELMSKAQGGGLAAIIGLSLEEVEARVTASGLAGIEIANINSPTQIVVGAPTETIQQFTKFSEGQSGRVVPLRVSGAFHTRYMREAQAIFGDFLATIAFNAPSIPVISNYTADLHSGDDIATNLANHLANPVRWTACIERLVLSGVDTFTEIGSRILTPMVNDIRDHLALRTHHDLAVATSQPVMPPSAEMIETSVFCTSFGFSKPLMVGASGYGAAGIKLISNLARDGVLSFLDTSGLSLEAIEHALKSLNADSSMIGKYGVSLDFHAESAEEALISLCLEHSVRYLEVRGYFEPTPALLRYRSAGGMDTQGRSLNRVILHVAEASVVDTFLAANEPLVNAICIDTKPWRGSAAVDEGVLLGEVLERCRLQSAAKLPFGKILIGLSGHDATQQPVEAALAKGADFASVSSVFLLATEAELDDAVKTRLSHATDQQFKPVPDWVYPALSTTTLSCVMDELAFAQATSLQQLYLQEDLSASVLRTLAAQLSAENNPVLPDSFINTCEGMRKLEIRAALRNRMQSLLFPRILHCDAPFPGFAQWLNARGVSLPVSANQLAHLIYSKKHLNG